MTRQYAVALIIQRNNQSLQTVWSYLHAARDRAWSLQDSNAEHPTRLPPSNPHTILEQTPSKSLDFFFFNQISNVLETSLAYEWLVKISLKFENSHVSLGNIYNFLKVIRFSLNCEKRQHSPHHYIFYISILSIKFTIW